VSFDQQAIDEYRILHISYHILILYFDMAGSIYIHGVDPFSQPKGTTA
jgi:hypothetical protein